MAEFALPDNTSKPTLSTSTIKAYTRKLNKLAEAGFNTPLKLRIMATRIVNFIRTEHPDDDATSRTHRRYYICAIYWVLPLSYRQNAEGQGKVNPYQALYQASAPLVDGGWNFNKVEYLANRA